MAVGGQDTLLLASLEEGRVGTRAGECLIRWRTLLLATQSTWVIKICPTKHGHWNSNISNTNPLASRELVKQILNRGFTHLNHF